MNETPPPPPPPLFTAAGTAAAPDYPALLGGRCEACGTAFFPMQSYGCETCGSEALQPMALAGKGRLVASAQVFIDVGPHRKAPFTVGSIVTDDGAVVRAVLAVDNDAPLTPGTAMVTCLVPETRPGRGDQDLRFTPAKDI